MVQNNVRARRRPRRARLLILLLTTALSAIVLSACAAASLFAEPTLAPTIAILTEQTPTLSPTPRPTFQPLARLLEVSSTQAAEVQAERAGIEAVLPPLGSDGDPAEQPPVPVTGQEGDPSLTPPARLDPQSTEIPLAEPQPAATLAPLEPTATFPPPPTAAPLPTRTPAPVQGLGSTFGWGLIPSEEGLVALRSNGSEMRLLTNDPIFHLSISPNGRFAAYITHPDPYNDYYGRPLGYALKLMNLASGSQVTLVNLDPPGVTMDSPLAQVEPAFLTMQAYENGGMAWSPGSTYLAFVSGHEGGMGEVYFYNTASNQIRRMSSFRDDFAEPTAAYNLSWSPTGRSVYYSAAHQFGQGEANWMAGAWVSGVDGSKVQVAGDELAGEKPVNWVNGEELLMTSWNEDCGTQNLRRVNLRTGVTQVLWPGCFGTYRYDRARREFLLSIPDHARYFGENNPGGLWLVHLWRDEKVQVSERGYDSLYNGDRRAAWYGYDQENGLMAIQRSGEVTPVFTGSPYDWTSPIAIKPVFHRPNDPSWLWGGDSGLYVATPGEDLRQVFDRAIEGFTTSSSRPDTFFFYAYGDDGGANLYVIRAGEWVPRLVNDELPNPHAIEWTN